MNARHRNLHSFLNLAVYLFLGSGLILLLALGGRIALRLPAMLFAQEANAMLVVWVTPIASRTDAATPAPATPSPTPPPPTATPQPTLTPAPQPRLHAGVDGANVRRGPDTAFERVGYLEPGAVAPIVGRHGGWWQVGYGGEVAWVYGGIVSAFDVGEVPEVAAPTLPAPTEEPAPTPPPAWAIDEGRWIDVDLSEQRLTAYEGTTPVKSYLVSTGLPATPTPMGQYRIWIKLPTDDMAGADYYIEDVPWVMYFHGGYGLHGVTWHANFGHPMSHGCVNQPTPEAEWLFRFADVGTLVNIHE
jgi:lipoprotein-anchoring transpeptidase ErfK/SrfK